MNWDMYLDLFIAFFQLEALFPEEVCVGVI